MKHIPWIVLSFLGACLMVWGWYIDRSGVVMSGLMTSTVGMLAVAFVWFENMLEHTPDPEWPFTYNKDHWL